MQTWEIDFEFAGVALIRLDQHKMLETQNLDDLRHQLTNIFSPHTLNLMKKDMEVDASLSAVQVGCLGLANLQFGKHTDVKIQAFEAPSHEVLMTNFVNSGKACVDQNGADWEVDAQHGFVCDGRISFDGHYEDYDALVFSVPINELKRQAAAMIGCDAAYVDFKVDQKIDLRTPQGKHLHASLRFVAEQLNGPLHAVMNPVIESNLESFLLSQFLALQPNSYHELLNLISRPQVLPGHVKRARDYIHANAHLPISTVDLATVAECSYRALQLGFKDLFDLSPMAYVKSVRLNGVRQDLVAGEGHPNISVVAAKWGFVHMGHFSRDYKKQFGVLPSQDARLEK